MPTPWDHITRPVRSASAAGLFVLALATGGQAQDWLGPTQYHPWVRFAPGAWKSVRVETETYDAEGNVTQRSTTITRSKLLSATETEYELQVETTVEVMGQRFPTLARNVRQTYRQRIKNDKKIGPGELKINGRTWETEVRQIEANGGETFAVSTVHFRADEPPIVLKRVTEAKDVETQEPRYQTVVEVTDMDKPLLVLGQHEKTWTVKTTHSQGESTTVTTETMSLDIPGGVIKRESEERDAEGRLVRKSTLDLEGYGFGLRRARLFPLLRRKK